MEFYGAGTLMTGLHRGRKRLLRGDEWGFTLPEVLIVIVIMGIGLPPELQRLTTDTCAVKTTVQVGATPAGWG